MGAYINMAPQKKKKGGNKKNKNVQQQIVAVPRRPVVKNSRNRDSDLESYRLALSDPFNIKSMGARVPDMYACPTATRHVTRTVSISSNSSGNAELIVLPNAFINACSTIGSVNGGTTWQLLDGNTIGTGLVVTSRTTLAGQLTNYRIVGYGVKVFSTMSMTSGAGKLVAATVPISSWLNDKSSPIGGTTQNATNTNANLENTLKAYGIPYTGSTTSARADPSQLPNLGNSIEVSAVALAEKPLTIVPKITSAEAFNFRQCDDSSVGFNIGNQTSVSYVNSGDASFLRVSGHEAVVLCWAGLPVTQTCMEVEIVYHLEGNPVLASAVVASDSNRSIVDPVGWMNVVKQVASLPGFKVGVQTIGNSFYPGLGSLVTKFL